MEKVKARLTKIKIKVGNLIEEPITMMYYHKSTN